MLSWNLLFAIGGVFALAVLAWWFVPILQARGLRRRQGLRPAEVARWENEYRKTVTQALGGAILLLTTISAFQQLHEARRNTEAELRESARSTDINSKNQLLAKGFDLLGRKSSAERLGGILILRDWASTSTEGETSNPDARYSILIPSLISLVKDATKFEIPTERCEQFEPPVSQMIGSDIQAVFDILKTRAPKGPLAMNMRGLNLSRVNLAGMDLSGSSFAFADLSEADLSGAKLHNANFYCTNLYRANLNGADLSGETNLAGALLWKASLQKAGGIPASLAGANLIKARISEAVLEETDLRGALLWGANMVGTTLVRVKVDDKTDLDKACLLNTRTVDTPMERVRNYTKVMNVQLNRQLQGDSWCEQDPIDIRVRVSAR